MPGIVGDTLACDYGAHFPCLWRNLDLCDGRLAYEPTVIARDGTTCALCGGGFLDCWMQAADVRFQIQAQSGSLAVLGGEPQRGCAVTSAGELICWHLELPPVAESSVLEPPATRVADVAVVTPVVLPVAAGVVEIAVDWTSRALVRRPGSCTAGGSPGQRRSRGRFASVDRRSRSTLVRVAAARWLPMTRCGAGRWERTPPRRTSSRIARSPS